MRDTSLNAARRSRELSELAETGRVDLLVIGGGVTGAGVALDAASRGLSVVLAEKHDLAFGTSRWSSKLVHGGLRYLASGHVGIAHESAVERGILLRHTAPHLTRPLPQLVPLLPTTGARQAALVRAGFLAGDALRVAARTGSSSLPGSRRIGAAETLRMAPPVRHEGLRGGLLAWDGQLTDDARLVTAIARTAAGHGARVLTRCAAEEVTGRGAVLRDRLGGEAVSVRARAVVNAAGVWAGEIAPELTLRPSRGTHLVVPADSLPGLDAGLTVPIPGTTNRFVFALPADDGRIHIGLTDEEAPGPVPDVPEAAAHEVDFLLERINTVLTEPLRPEDVLDTYSGLRPLLDGGAESGSADLSRSHAVLTGGDGVVSVVGGKLTTYRRMAEDAVDEAIRRSGLHAGPCRTGRLPLVGAADRARLARVRAPRRLVARYGTEAPAVLEQAGGDPAALEPVTGDTSTTPAELRFAVRHEGALDTGDLLDRRTRLGVVARDREAALPAAEEALG
ncbi:glycerol-3-phosphate dehydrogenase [Actinopolyspora xinjiangensis]|uniref:Glycerol-3-phosphate dehydrogenase n=1 Tax=Actinopolyspora xinjiangensis TaxID=405564 RepID=A0A1H0QKP7_9ACTN|nr:glycerol-3-phosphate dehydrogenase/oxidase [Actinopolyspora xinjiangensis]SDP17306.1 glycerol-3-phosphate dehydrogenase [Actinopolyspora xinjiangensis]